MRTLDPLCPLPAPDRVRRGSPPRNVSGKRAPAARGWLLCCLLWLIATPWAAHAQQQYWYDGDQRRVLWSEPSLVADFSARSAKKSQIVKPSALAKGDPGRQSPVFRERKEASSAPMALPGGVILRFDPAASTEQQRALMAKHGLQPVRELGDGTGVWLMASEPGLPSLELANRLYESGDFAAASPNWWRPRALK